MRGGRNRRFDCITILADPKESSCFSIRFQLRCTPNLRIWVLARCSGSSYGKERFSHFLRILASCTELNV